jgi:nucleoside-diphosphate-sugar epimerase
MDFKGNVRLLVTGASGFIGTNAVEFALANGIPVVNFDIRPPRNPSHNACWKKVDIRERGELAAAVKAFSPTHILHLAAVTGMDVDNLEYFAANTTGVQNLIDSTFGAPDLRKTVFTSSLLVCRNGYIPKDDIDYCPPNLYGKSKVIGEQMVRSSPMAGKWAIVRPTSIWGPWFELSYMTFFRMVSWGLYIHPGKTPIVKPLGFVGNTVHMMLELLFSEADSTCRQTYYLADYPEHSIQEWGNLIQRNLGTRPIPVMPIGIMRAIASVGDVCKKLGWQDPPLTNFRLNNMLTGAHYPIEKIQDVVGALPHSMEDGVRQTIQWMYEQGKIKSTVVPRTAS